MRIDYRLNLMLLSYHILQLNSILFYTSSSLISNSKTKPTPKTRPKTFIRDLRFDPEPIRKFEYSEGPNLDPDSKILDPSKTDPYILIFKSVYPDP